MIVQIPHQNHEVHQRHYRIQNPHPHLFQSLIRQLIQRQIVGQSHYQRVHLNHYQM
ncbi:hypothetical protein [Weissella coleopterorum]|uniref:hypothetical protein n=1 Tax=Weissella coleopterorum TaxID=2714949 RepID=UPI0019800AEB|nr:hypothetical protein [Weissella coleopterorum]